MWLRDAYAACIAATAATTFLLPWMAPPGRDRARLNCVVRDGASDWMRAIPSKALGLHLRAGEFSFGAKYRLGLPVFTEEGECPASQGEGERRVW